jgi:hypothetical protein
MRRATAAPQQPMSAAAVFVSERRTRGRRHIDDVLRSRDVLCRARRKQLRQRVALVYEHLQHLAYGAVQVARGRVDGQPRRANGRRIGAVLGVDGRRSQLVTLTLTTRARSPCPTAQTTNAPT